MRDTTSHLLNGCLQKTRVTNAEDVKKKEHLFIVGVNVNWYSYYGG